MSDQLPITVVIPAYNAGAFIREALESVHRQTMAPSETIVVDDGSSDETAALARACGARVISQTNRGISHARNVAIRAASTPWIAFLDADDAWSPQRLERQWQLHERHPGPLLLACDYVFVDDGRRGRPVLPTLPRYRGMPRTRLEKTSVFVARRDLLHAIVQGNFVLPSSMLVARSLFEDYATFFLEREFLSNSADDFAIGEDYEWLLRILRHTDVLFLEEALVDYRRTPTSASAIGGRLRYGDVKLGEIVQASPQRYAPGADVEFARVRTRQLREAGIRYLQGGNVARARDVFAQQLHRNRHWQSFALYVLTLPFASPFGRTVYGRLHSMWRRRFRPVLRAIRRDAP